jgi:signal transduction histidine kinase
VLVASSVLIALLAAFYAFRRLDADSPAVEVVGVLWALSVPAVAAAFLLGLLRRRLQLANVLLRLSGPLNDGLSPAGVREALARALVDPALEVLVADPAPGRWRDLQGRLAPGPAARDDGRPVTVLSDDKGARVALVHDPALRDDLELLDAVGALVLAAVHHRRLESQLTESLHALAVSRRRIARAADRERSRIERDLHDGAQQRLIRLRIKLTLAEELLATDAERGARAVHELGEEVERTLDELRLLAHGVYPAILRDRGLGDALRTLAAETPLTVHLQVTGVTRHPQEVEAAVYYTIAEALQNAAKHASAATSVGLTLRQAGVLELEVRDDGPGFVPGEQNGTSGLRNMRDRLEAVGGRLTLDTAPGRGTRILGRVPLDD